MARMKRARMALSQEETIYLQGVRSMMAVIGTGVSDGAPHYDALSREFLTWAHSDADAKHILADLTERFALAKIKSNRSSGAA